jgi:NADH:ubiquinone oxidoreductase subunit E
MTKTIPNRKERRRADFIEKNLVEDVLEDDTVFAEKLKEKRAPKVAEEEVPKFDANWKRTHNHRVPENKRVFNRITYKDVEEAIWASEGMLTNVARKLEISVYYVKQILSKYKVLRQDFEEYREALLDEAEMCLRAKIRRGDTSAMIFFLKCVGKQRGYIEYEKQAPKKGSVKMKIVPASEAKKVKKGDTPGVTTNVIAFKKAENDG